jgi:glycosyltransferase involved in cell wall biosynthesis
MSTGLPMVATSVGGIPEIITNGVDGFIVPPKHPEAIAEAIIPLVKDLKLREIIGNKAREKILNHYTSEKVVNDYLEIFNSVKR